MSEKIIETRACRQCSIPFFITDKDIEFYAKVSPVFGGERYLLPLPTVCPTCRAQAMLSLRNERTLYKTTCAATGKETVSIHSPDHTFPVYDQKYWWSDGWSALDYGQEFDFSRPFFEQFRELYDRVPKISLNAPKSQNCEYTNQCLCNKDCYLIFCTSNSENCYYGMWTQDSKYCMDCLYVEYSEHCYELINAVRCHSCTFSTNLEDCYSVHISRDMVCCKNCIGCIGLSNREYCIFNEQYTKEVYKERLAELRIDEYGAIQALKEQFKIATKNAPVKYYSGKKNESFSGDYLQNNKETYHCFNARDNEETKYCRDSWRVVQSYDLIETLALDHCLCVEGTGYANSCLFSMKMISVNFILYSSHCNFSNHLFGCVGLNNQEYCILNKQYTKDEYEKLVPKIIEHMRQTGEWGEFFPVAMSPFGYHETVAQEYFPLTREEALAKGFNWSEYEPPAPQVSKTIPADRLPNRIEDIPDDILNWAIVCEVSGKPFRIVKQELEFYRKHHLPIPHRHHDQRHLDRMSLRNPRKLHERKCDKCGVDMQTTYAPERPEKVYCETCYDREVYG